MKFTDYSFWNGVVNTQKAKEAGASGAYWKASQATFTDKRFKENASVSVLTYNGAYHFLDTFNYPAGGEVYWGQKQAAYHVAVKNEITKLNLKSALDLEDNSGSGWTKLDLVLDKALKIALAWVNEYKTLTGHYPVMYLNSGLTVRKDYLGRWIFRNFQPCPLWVANYNNILVPPTGAWQSAALWQKTSKGDGAAFGNSSGNMFVDVNEVIDLAALTTNPVPVPEDEVDQPADNPLKTYCKYCNGFTFDDMRGNCGACGAPREPLQETDKLAELWEDYMKRLSL